MSSVVEDKNRSVKEGEAVILQPDDNSVFYNKIQQFNRDLSVVGIRTWAQQYAKNHAPKKRKREQSGEAIKPEDTPFIDIVEALAASGLRSIRYAKEIPQVRNIIANDLKEEAVEHMKKNVEFNNVQDIVSPIKGDANVTMLQQRHKNVHVVDLDPYGSATPFVDAAVQAVVDEGLLLVTCTDLAILAGNGFPEKCFSQYGGSTLYTDGKKESALRLVLNMVASTAAKYGKSIEPLLSLSIDYYVRVFIRVHSSPINVKLNMSKTMTVYHCSGCGATTNQPLGVARHIKDNNYKYGWAQVPQSIEANCKHCGYVHHVAGPMWAGNLHNKEFVSEMIKLVEELDPEVYGTTKRMQGMLTVALNEIEAPFSVAPQSLAKVIRSSCPPFKDFISALLNAGYQVSETHVEAGNLKTNAPYSTLWDIMRAWVIQKCNGQASSKLKENSPGYRIMQDLKECDPPISFEEHHDAVSFEIRRKSKLVRFQQNPEENWGPMAKAK